MKCVSSLWTLAVAILVSTATAQAAIEHKEIVMGFNPAENVDVVEMNGKAFSEYYEKKTGYKVKTFIATDYTALIEALRSGRIDFAWLPPFSYVKAEKIDTLVEFQEKCRTNGRRSYSEVLVELMENYNKLN